MIYLISAVVMLWCLSPKPSRNTQPYRKPVSTKEVKNAKRRTNLKRK